MRTRCKFEVTKVEDNGHGSKVFTFETRYCPEVAEDARYTKYTPWGEMRVCIDNPAVVESLKLGQLCYIDIETIDTAK